MLRAGVDLGLRAALERLHGDGAAERGVGEGHLERGDQVRLLALEALVLGDAHHDVQVAAHAGAVRAHLRRRRLAFAGHAHHLAIRDAARDLDAELALHAGASGARALAALVLDDLPAALAGGARGDHAEQAAEAVLRHLALSAARGAFGGLAAGLGTASLAGAADLEPLERDLALAAFEHLDQGDLHLGLEVVAARGAALAPAATAALAAEDVVEHREDVLDVHRVEVVSRAAAEAGVAVAVIDGALLGIAQDLVGLGAFLEADLRLVVARVLVRMPLDGEAPVGALHFVAVGIARDAEDLVVVGRGAHARIFPSRGFRCPAARARRPMVAGRTRGRARRHMPHGPGLGEITSFSSWRRSRARRLP